MTIHLILPSSSVPKLQLFFFSFLECTIFKETALYTLSSFIFLFSCLKLYISFENHLFLPWTFLVQQQQALIPNILWTFSVVDNNFGTSRNGNGTIILGWREYYTTRHQVNMMSSIVSYRTTTILFKNKKTRHMMRT